MISADLSGSCCPIHDTSSALTFWQLGVTLLGQLEVEEVSAMMGNTQMRLYKKWCNGRLPGLCWPVYNYQDARRFFLYDLLNCLQNAAERGEAVEI